jgi:hypothetical protein
MKIFETRDSQKRRVIYQYKDNELTVLPLEDFNFHDILTSNPDPYVYNLPVELYSEIIKQVFCIRLSTRNLDLLMDLAKINRFTTRLVYDQLYGIENESPVQISIVEMLKRISATMNLLMNLHDDYVICERYDYRKVGIRLHHQDHAETNPNLPWVWLNGRARVQRNLITHTADSPTIRNTVVNPWDFCSNFEITQIERANTFTGMSAIHGDFYGDTIFVDGRNRHGMYDCTKIQHPIFTFLLVESDRALLIPTHETFELTHTFGCLTDMLRIMYGPQTGVYFMVREEDEITSHSDSFIQLVD